MASVEDVNADGFPDGTPFVATDSIQIVPPE